jgi:hypothetical protein
LQLSTSAVQPHLDCGQRQLQKLSDLFGGKSFAVVQQKDRLATVGHPGNVPLDTRAHFFLLDHGKRRWPCPVGKGQFLNPFVHRPVSGFRPLPHAVDAHMGSNPIKPALQCRRISQRTSLPMCTNKGFLRQILSLGSVPNQVTDVSRYCTAVLLKFI